MEKHTDIYELYDLQVRVVGDQKSFVCGHRVGDYFEVSGENISIPMGKIFSLYALAALLPLIPAKQRETHKNDWMTTDMDVACPDPNCGARFRIVRMGKRKFRHSEVTVVPLIERKKI